MPFSLIFSSTLSAVIHAVHPCWYAKVMRNLEILERRRNKEAKQKEAEAKEQDRQDLPV